MNFAIGSVARRQRSALNAPLCSHRGPRAKGARPPRRTTRLNGCRDYLSSLAAKSDILVESPAVSISLRRQEIETVTGYISDSLIHAHFIAVQKDSDQYSQLKGRSLAMVPLHFSMSYVGSLPAEMLQHDSTDRGCCFCEGVWCWDGDRHSYVRHCASMHVHHRDCG